MQELVDIYFPQAAVISVVLDKLNTHTPAALDAIFAPAEACRMLQKLDFHYTPKYGSWLNMAEIECAVVSTQCLDRWVGDQETVRHELAAGETHRHSTLYDPCGEPLSTARHD